MINKIKKFIRSKRRLKRPYSILFLGSAFIVSPIINVIYSSIAIDKDFFMVLTNYGLAGNLLLAFAPVVGYGILSIRRWGWYAFLLYALLVIFYNVKLLVSQLQGYYISNIVQSLVFLIFAAYFFRKDIRAPYFTNKGRVFRTGSRKEISKPVYINGTSYNTIDISRSGVLVEYTNCTKEPGEMVKVQFYKNKKMYRGEIVRVDDTRVGIAFR